MTKIFGLDAVLYTSSHRLKMGPVTKKKRTRYTDGKKLTNSAKDS